jgi:hypothetical protein
VCVHVCVCVCVCGCARACMCACVFFWTLSVISVFVIIKTIYFRNWFSFCLHVASCRTQLYPVGPLGYTHPFFVVGDWKGPTFSFANFSLHGKP